MIKRPAKYQDFEDPQARPRYTGIATFFRAAFCASRPTRWISASSACRSMAGSPTGPARATGHARCANNRRCCGASTPRPASPRSHRAGPRSWRLLDRAALRAGGRIARNRNILPDGHVGRRVPLVGRRRSCDQPADPASGGGRRVRSGWSISTRIATPATIIWARASIMVPRSGARWRRTCSTRKRVIQIGIRGSTNDPDIWGFSQRSGMRVLPMDEFSDRGWRYAGEEARRIVGRRADLSELRYRQP